MNFLTIYMCILSNWIDLSILIKDRFRKATESLDRKQVVKFYISFASFIHLLAKLLYLPDRHWREWEVRGKRNPSSENLTRTLLILDREQYHYIKYSFSIIPFFSLLVWNSRDVSQKLTDKRRSGADVRWGGGSGTIPMCIWKWEHWREGGTGWVLRECVGWLVGGLWGPYALSWPYSCHSKFHSKTNIFLC